MAEKIETWEHRGCPVELEDPLLQRFAGAEGKSEKEVCYRALPALAAAYVRTDQRDRIESLLVRTSEAAFGVERAKQPYFVWLFDEHDQYPDIRRIPETGFHHDPAEFSKSILLNHQAVKEFDYLP